MIKQSAGSGAKSGMNGKGTQAPMLLLSHGKSQSLQDTGKELAFWFCSTYSQMGYILLQLGGDILNISINPCLINGVH
jgi:hypothetical protein